MKASISRGAGFGGVCGYVLDPAKRAEIVSSNMSSDTPADLTQEFGQVRSMRREIKNPVWHCSLSLPPPEKLDPDQWDKVIRAHLQNVGIDAENHQFVAAQHHDKDHSHCHIVVNRIGINGQIYHGRNDVLKSIASTQKLEKQYGLQVTPGLESSGAKPMTRAERARAERTGELPARLKIQQAIDGAPNNSLEDFVIHLREQGVNVRPSGASGAPQGVSFETDGIAFKGSALGKKYAWASIAKKVRFDPDSPTDQEVMSDLRSQEFQAQSQNRVAGLESAEQAESILREAFGKNSTIAGDALEDLLLDASPDVAALVQSSLTRAGTDSAGRPVFTSTAILRQEQQLIADAKALKSSTSHDLTDLEIANAISKKEAEATAKIGKPVSMTDEQKEAVRHGLKGGLSIVQGSAGAGKSFSNEAIKIGYEARGYSVLGAAVSKKASSVLESETGIKSATVAKLIKDLDDQKIQLNDKTCIVVDEAGLLSSSQWASLTSHANKAGAKIVASGEDKQLDAVSHGGALRYLSRSDVIGAARIEKIVRQNKESDRRIVMSMRDGKMIEPLLEMSANGLIDFSETPREKLLSDYFAYQSNNPDKNSLIVCHKNADARALGASIRAVRREEGIVTGEDYSFKASHGENKFDLAIATGDRIRLNKNNSEQDLQNGDTGSIQSISQTPDDYEITVSLDRGGSRTFLASEYQDEDGRLQMSLGYATTVYSSQGMTVGGDVFVLQTSGMDRANTYVACSRAKDSSHLYVNSQEIKDLSELIKTASRDQVKELALEAAERLPEPADLTNPQPQEQNYDRYHGIPAGIPLTDADLEIAIRQPDFGEFAGISAPPTLDEVRNLSGLDLVASRDGTQIVLPNHENHKLDKSSESADQGVRRNGASPSEPSQPGVTDEQTQIINDAARARARAAAAARTNPAPARPAEAGSRFDARQERAGEPQRIHPDSRHTPTPTTRPAAAPVANLGTGRGSTDPAHVHRDTGAPAQANQVAGVGITANANQNREELDGSAKVALKQLQNLLQSHTSPAQAVQNMANDGYTKQSVKAAAKAAGVDVDVEAIYRKVMEERALLEAMEAQENAPSHSH